ncbi:Gamma-interferon-inducible lysosomal thiol reductase [Halotydeus destructor]|nr:Gamma-interferon-inducible lysosomal thiol reductase [Halotydeus destructor]
MLRLIAVLLCLGSVLSVVSDEKVKVSVYYETLCSDSKQFITRQLFPVYQNLSQIMDFELIVYGNANYTVLSNGTINFNCQHGPRECYANLVQGCAIKNGDIDAILPFINCAELGRHPDTELQKCALESGLSWQKLTACSSSAEGQQILAQNGRRTDALEPRHNFIPWIIINDVYSKVNQHMALVNLKKLVCSTFKGKNKPSACN